MAVLGRCIIVLSLFIPLSALAATESEIQRLKNAVVKIHTTTAAPDYFTPWRRMSPQQSSGSGSVIDGQRILTNAHVVADARYLQVQKNSDPRKYQARVEFVSHEADLAILRVPDKTFFDDLNPLTIGVLPKPLQEVSVYGYPAGGNSLSITRGILSRVEHQYYAHSEHFLLAGQIDAAINPGNSGGPVIADGQIAGVVMQANLGSQSENQGYFVPPSVIRHVLADAADGNHDGIPDLGFRTQEMESPALKRAFSVTPDQGGVLIARVFANSPASDLLQTGDVLLSIDGYAIADNGSIAVREDLRTNYKYAIDQHHVGDSVTLTVARQGKIREMTLMAEARLDSYSLVREEAFDSHPDYYIFGGVVFVPLNMNLIKRWRDWRNNAPTEFLYARNRWTSADQRELVVALKVLAADVNLGYHSWSNWIVESVNGVPIRDFQHFAYTVRNAASPHVVLEDEDGFKMVIDNQQARQTEQQILELYQIPSAHSPGLFEKPLLLNPASD